MAESSKRALVTGGGGLMGPRGSAAGHEPQHSCPLGPAAKCSSCDCWKSCSLNFLDDAWRERLRRNRQVRRYLRRQYVFRESQVPQGLFIMCGGHVRTLKEEPGGQQLTLRYLACGEFLGVSSFLAGQRYCNSAEAIRRSTVCFLEADFVHEMMDAYREFERRLLLHMARKVRQTVRHTTGWALKSADRRLAEFLLSVNRPVLDAGRADCGSVAGPYTRKSIAQCVGVTLETVVRKLSLYEKKGWVRLDKKDIEILDRAALEAVIDGRGPGPGRQPGP